MVGTRHQEMPQFYGLLPHYKIHATSRMSHCICTPWTSAQWFRHLALLAQCKMAQSACRMADLARVTIHFRWHSHWWFLLRFYMQQCNMHECRAGSCYTERYGRSDALPLYKNILNIFDPMAFRKCYNDIQLARIPQRNMILDHCWGVAIVYHVAPPLIRVTWEWTY